MQNLCKYITLMSIPRHVKIAIYLASSAYFWYRILYTGPCHGLMTKSAEGIYMDKKQVNISNKSINFNCFMQYTMKDKFSSNNSIKIYRLSTCLPPSYVTDDNWSRCCFSDWFHCICLLFWIL